MTNKELERIKETVLKRLKDHDIKHGPDHLRRVTKNALKAVKILNLEKKIDLNLLQAICLLHDITYVQPKFKYRLADYVLERSIATRVLYPILKSLSINQSDSKKILQACSKHPHSFPFKRLNKSSDYYTKILQDSDTIDFFNQKRVTQFKRQIKPSFISGLIKPFFNPYINYGRKNLKRYLNYPQLYEKLFLSKNQA